MVVVVWGTVCSCRRAVHTSSSSISCFSKIRLALVVQPQAESVAGEVSVIVCCRAGFVAYSAVSRAARIPHYWNTTGETSPGCWRRCSLCYDGG